MFYSENELVKNFKVSFCKNFLNKIEINGIQRHLLIDEFDSLNGIADLVIGIYRPYIKRKNSRHPINPNWVTPLKKLANFNEISLDDYAAIFRFSHRTAKKQLEEFEKADFLKCAQKNNYKITNKYDPILETVISIEAKLRNWKHAIKQAYRYKRFSNFAYVLLDEHYAKPAISNLEMFKKYNIGLMTLTRTTLHIYFKPVRKNRLKSDSHNRLNEVMYAQWKLAG